MNMMTGEEAFDAFEFWRLDTVERKTGLSKTTIYERMRDTDPATNPFPPSHAYRGGREASRSRYWVSGEVRAWQRRERGVDPISAEAVPVPADVLGMLG